MIRIQAFAIYDEVERMPRLRQLARACVEIEPKTFFENALAEMSRWQRMYLKKELEKLSEMLPQEDSRLPQEKEDERSALLFAGVWEYWNEIRQARRENWSCFHEKISDWPKTFRTALRRALRRQTPELAVRQDEGVLEVTLNQSWGGWRLNFQGCGRTALDDVVRFDYIHMLLVQREDTATTVVIVGYDSLRREMEQVYIPFESFTVTPFAESVFCAPDAPLCSGQEEDYRSTVMRIAAPLSDRFADLGEEGLSDGEKRALVLALLLSGREDSAALLGKVSHLIDSEELLSGFSDSYVCERLRDEMSAALHGDEKMISRAQEQLDRLLSPLHTGKRQRLLYRDAWQVLLWKLSERKGDQEAHEALVRLPERQIPEPLRPAVAALQTKLDSMLAERGFSGAFPFYRRQKGHRGEYLYAVLRISDNPDEGSEPSVMLTFRVGKARLSKRREAGSAKNAPKRPYLATLDFEEVNALDCMFEQHSRCRSGRLGSMENPLIRVTSNSSPVATENELKEQIETVERVLAGKPAAKSYRAEKFSGQLDARSILASVLVGMLAAVCFYLLSLLVLSPVFVVLAVFLPTLNWFRCVLIIPAVIGIIAGLIVGCSGPTGILVRRAFPLL